MPRSRQFALALALIAVAAFVLRVSYILAFRDQYTDFFGDSLFYSKAANVLANGGGFNQPLTAFSDNPIPAAEHPPLYIIWLAIPSFLTGGHEFSQTSQMLWSGVAGAATVVVIGLAGRRIAGPWCGLIAAGLAAVYPNIWVHDGELLSETIVMLTVALIILAAYRFVDRPTVARAVWLGAACGLSALARPEMLLAIVLVLAPVVLLARSVAWRERVVALVGGGVVALLVITPWVAFNLSRFEEPVYLSVNFAATLSAANCDDTYYGPNIGFKNYNCGFDSYERVVEPGMDPSEGAQAIQDDTLTYINSHRSRVPVVVAARIGRILSVYSPSTDLNFDQLIMNRNSIVAQSTLWSWYLLAPIAVVGAVILRRRRVPLLPLLAFPAIVLVAVAVTFAQLRYRAPAEPAVVLLAAVAIDAGRRRLRGGSAAGSDERDLPADADREPQAAAPNQAEAPDQAAGPAEPVPTP